MSYPEPPIKRKNQSPLRVIVNAWGCLLGFVMLGLGGAVGLIGAMFLAPQLLGFNLTATALAEQQIVLASTAVDLEARARNAEVQATNFAFEVEATRAVIFNEFELLGQTATQSSQNIRATETAVAENNIARQTQLAIDYDSTQAQLQANATDAELDFRNTQAAFGVPQAQINSTVRDPNDFTMGLDESVWQISSPEDWQLNDLGLAAIREDAWILEQEANLLGTGDYALEIRLQHSLQPHSEYWILIVNDNEGVASYLRAEGRVLSEAAFYSFDLASLENGELSFENAALLSRMTANSPLGEEMIIHLDYDSGWMRVMVNEQILLLIDSSPVTHGRFGIQMPVLATLQHVEQR